MNTWLLALIALLLAGYVAGCALLALRIRSIYNNFLAFIVPADDKSESPASLLYAMLIKRLAVELKVTIMGSMGGKAKGEAYAEQAVMQDMVEAENPAIGAIMTAFPSLGKSLRKNPALMSYALSKISGLGKAPVKAAALGGDGGGGGGFSSNPNKYG